MRCVKLERKELQRRLWVGVFPQITGRVDHGKLLSAMLFFSMGFQAPAEFCTTWVGQHDPVSAKLNAARITRYGLKTLRSFHGRAKIGFASNQGRN